MEGVRNVFVLAFGLTLAGCGSQPDVPFHNWLPDDSGRPAVFSDSFKELARAASEAERIAENDLRKVSFTPWKKTELLNRLAGPMALASQASRGEIQMPERAADPFQTLPYQNGWRMIGRAMVWKIERAVAMEELGGAVDWTLAATRFGLALNAGGATDASLGFAILDEAQRAFEPAFPKLSPADLRKLGTGIEAALKNRPPVENLIENERISMLKTVQLIQNAFRDKKLGILLDELGKDIGPAIDYLDKLNSESPVERAAYFKDFAEEAEIWSAHYGRALRRNARQRADAPNPELKEERPWRRFSKHFLRSLEPLLAMRDASLAQTRLLGLSALLLAECRTNGVAPGSLTGISSDLTTDPYSGLALQYRPDGEHFLLYSVGPDLKDDGGEMLETTSGPDLQLRALR